MKILVMIVLSTACFVSPAFAERTFQCSGQNLTADLKISDPRVKDGSYQECNGGVGDEMIDCRTHHYQIAVQDVAISVNVNNGKLQTQMELQSTGKAAIAGFKMLIYEGSPVHIHLRGTLNNPVLDIIFLATNGTSASPVPQGEYVLSCQ